MVDGVQAGYRLPPAGGPGAGHRATGARRTDGEQHQVLLGVTGSGKTFTMAKVIERPDRPALVLAHNKTLAAQLYHEFRTFFPPTRSSTSSATTTTTSRKPTSRRATSTSKKRPRSTTNWTSCGMSATRSLFERRDCVIVASVSCIYGLGSPEAYYGMLLMLEKGQKIARQQILRRLVEIQYERNDVDFRRGHVPRARRRDRDLSDLRGLRLPHRAVGRRDREPLADRPAAGAGAADLPAAADLSQDALRHERGDARDRRWRVDRDGAASGGTRSWRSRASWSRRSGCGSAPCSTWR